MKYYHNRYSAKNKKIFVVEMGQKYSQRNNSSLAVSEALKDIITVFISNQKKFSSITIISL